jgi:sigma-B regulation protein RsbU (phosphoserine phosphatase)
LAAVRRYQILDTPPDGAFDRVAALAVRMYRVPIATVTIVDEDRIWFKARHGLPDGVTEIGRDPGLCASAITQDDLYVVPDAGSDPRTAGNPLVTGELGLRFYAAAPILTQEGHRLGTVNIIDNRPREIDPAELKALPELAAVVMDELELRLAAMRVVRLERELRQAAEQEKRRLEMVNQVLHRSLVPPVLPPVPGLEIAAERRLPADDAPGHGDFYDIFRLDDGRWAFFLGEVGGTGPVAAVITALGRYALRSAALRDPDPIAVLAGLNTTLQRDHGISDPVRCSVVFGLLAEDFGGFELTLAGGGRPIGLLMRAGGAVQRLGLQGEQLLGASADPGVAVVTTRLRPGDGLLLATSGLAEARTPAGEPLGADGVRRAVVALAGRGAQGVAVALRRLLDGPGPAEGTALLALTVPAAGAAPAQPAPE